MSFSCLLIKIQIGMSILFLFFFCCTSAFVYLKNMNHFNCYSTVLSKMSVWISIFWCACRCFSLCLYTVSVNHPDIINASCWCDYGEKKKQNLTCHYFASGAMPVVTGCRGRKTRQERKITEGDLSIWKQHGHQAKVWKYVIGWVDWQTEH